MKTLEFFIPGDPKGKQRPQFNSVSKNAFTPIQTMRYEDFVKIFIHSKWEAGEIVRWGAKEPLFMFCTSVHRPSKADAKLYNKLMGMLWPAKKPDFDNIAKIIADAMNDMVFPDDAQIVGTLLYKRFVAEGEIAGVYVRVIDMINVDPGLTKHFI